MAYAFPDVKIVTTEVDHDVNENFYILPGLGTICVFGHLQDSGVRSDWNLFVLSVCVFQIFTWSGGVAK